MAYDIATAIAIFAERDKEKRQGPDWKEPPLSTALSRSRLRSQGQQRHHARDIGPCSGARPSKRRRLSSCRGRDDDIFTGAGCGGRLDIPF